MWIGYSDESASERGGSANIRAMRTCALRSDTEAKAAHPLVDLSALRRIYSTALTESMLSAD